MKKLLLSCFLALGIGASAQYNVTQNFDGGSPYDGLIFFGAGSAASTAQFCSGTTSWASAATATVTQSGPAIDFSTLAVPQTTKGQKIAVSINYKKPSTTLTGTLYLTYNIFDPVANSWSINVVTSKAITAAAVSTCTALSGTIAAGVLNEASLPAGSKYSIGAFFARTAGTGPIYIDDLKIVEDVVATAPACTTITAPTNGSTVGYGAIPFSWTAAATATQYKVTVGTTSGASDVYSATVAGNVTSVSIPLQANSTYYASVIPSNANGIATGCSEITFNTNNNLTYCSSAATSATFEKISNVTFGTINNNSTSTGGYEDFTSISTDVIKGNSYTISVSNSDYDTADSYFVWIDFNKNGVFEDSEKTTLASAAVATGSITIPATSTVTSTRMRVKMIYNTPAATACGSFSFGQVEDYTVNILDNSMAVSTETKTAVSVYPNPFTDVLKISDVKGVKSVSISDVAGRLVKTMKPSAELNVADLKTGLYIVTLNMEDGSSKTIKAIKK
ncbi:hypothetical protein CBW16_02735 [Flavobacteriaceae bacterium JJC]|nr:hypothetical protein CBW16_02735 [Flavobacteriaceae bacterium JJC]